MTAAVFMLNDLLRKNTPVWYGSFILFVIALTARIMPVFVKDGYVIYFINAALLSAAVLVCSAILFSVILHKIPDAEKIKHEVIFYRGLGLGVMGQFVLKSVITALAFVLMFGMVSMTVWSIQLKYFLLGMSFCMFFLMMRTLSVLINIRLVYYLGILLIMISLVYPMYVLPNTAYVVRSASYNVHWYLLTYCFLYLAIGFKLFYSKWREECTGWIY
jgi:hypothetical protein